MLFFYINHSLGSVHPFRLKRYRKRSLTLKTYIMMFLLAFVTLVALSTTVHAQALNSSPVTGRDFHQRIPEDGMDARPLRIFFENFTREEYTAFHVNLLMEQFPVFQERKTAIESYLRLLWQRSLERFGKGLNTLTIEQSELLTEIPEIQQAAAEALSLSEEDVTPAAAASGCYTGVTMYDQKMTEQKNYTFTGSDGSKHVGLYFRVDGNANCYKKECAMNTWGGDCGNKKIPYWHLFCKDTGCPWYKWNGKYVKDVVMLVPGGWWDFYWWWPKDVRAKQFWMSWGPNQETGGSSCDCDPGCY